MALHRPKPGDHYFRSHPLLGFALQSFSPPAQPYAVSDASALWPFNAKRNSRHRHEDTPKKAEAKKDTSTRLNHAKAPTKRRNFRALLHARVRNLDRRVRPEKAT
jgi:hypothetical protein